MTERASREAEKAKRANGITDTNPQSPSNVILESDIVFGKLNVIGSVSTINGMKKVNTDVSTRSPLKESSVVNFLKQA
jgi:hypothetical protein